MLTTPHPSLPPMLGRASLLVLEDNEAVLKMIIKGRSLTLRHGSRTHRIDLDWLFERFHEDPGLFIKYVSTKKQIADMLTKGRFTGAQWRELLNLSGIRSALPLNS